MLTIFFSVVIQIVMGIAFIATVFVMMTAKNDELLKYKSGWLALIFAVALATSHIAFGGKLKKLKEPVETSKAVYLENEDNTESEVDDEEKNEGELVVTSSVASDGEQYDTGKNLLRSVLLLLNLL